MQYKKKIFLPDGTGLEPRVHDRVLHNLQALITEGNFDELIELFNKAHDPSIKLSYKAKLALQYKFLAQENGELDPDVAGLVKFAIQMHAHDGNEVVVFTDMANTYAFNDKLYRYISRLTQSEHTVLVVAIEQNLLTPRTSGYRHIKEFLVDGQPRKELIEALKEFQS